MTCVLYLPLYLNPLVHHKMHNETRCVKLDKLAIVFEAVTAFKAALYSLFNSKSPIFSEVKTHVNASSICFLEGYTRLLSPLPQD